MGIVEWLFLRSGARKDHPVPAGMVVLEAGTADPERVRANLAETVEILRNIRVSDLPVTRFNAASAVWAIIARLEQPIV